MAMPRTLRASNLPIISHDRCFLAGTHQEYEADKMCHLGEEGAKPKRIRYKPISR